MNDRKQALEALRDKVKAGADAPFCEMTDDQINQFASREITLVQSAYHGSLDAAKALHDAVLPRHSAQLYFWAAPTLCRADVSGGHSVRDGNPARAWLLAILSALISETPDTPKGETQ